LSFATLKKPRDVDVFVKAADRDLKSVRAELTRHYPVFDPRAGTERTGQRKGLGHSLYLCLYLSTLSVGKTDMHVGAVVIIDSLNALASSSQQSLATFLSSIITPAVSIVSVYHTDVPVTLPKPFIEYEYEPHPFTVLCHLATAILRLSSLSQEIERQRARNRSVVEPEWGLREEREGVLIGLKGSGSGSSREGDMTRGVVIDMELRRRSGRTTTEKFTLMPASTAAASAASTVREPGTLTLLSDHAMFASPEGAAAQGGADGDEEQQPESTFDLGLTEKQRRDREGIVLPYFDAQEDIGAGEGGRILYDMGREDDFDDEEDEI
jgi:elongator complex protein 5